MKSKFSCLYLPIYLSILYIYIYTNINRNIIYIYTHLIFPFCQKLRAAGTHGRSWLFPEGNRGYNFVRFGNRLASRVVLLMYYSLSLLCRFLLEQPQGSRAPAHPRLDCFFKEQNIFTLGIWGGAYATNRSTTTPKRHWLWSNDEQLLSELGLAAGHLTAADLSSMEGDPLVKRRKKEDGSTSWSGIKERLHESQCGPEFLARLCGFLLGAPQLLLDKGLP